jgi:IS5 family transposase
LANGIGLTKGGRNTKLHVVCDGRGRPHLLLLTPGNVHDMTVARVCIAAIPRSAYLVADKAYDGNDLRDWLAERGTTAVIPPKRHRKVQLAKHGALELARDVGPVGQVGVRSWQLPPHANLFVEA